jgi:hypothetical protein
MLYLSAIPFDQLGFPKLGSVPIPQQAETVMRQTPIVALTVASLASALAWLLRRREQKWALPHAPANTAEERNGSANLDLQDASIGETNP